MTNVQIVNLRSIQEGNPSKESMKFRIILCLVIIVSNLSSQARLVRQWSEAELRNASDLIVVGLPIETKDLDETNSLGWSQSASFQPKFRGVETTFKVSSILKGSPTNQKIILHHFRFEPEWGSPPNGPTLIDFKPGDTNEYLLYLINDGTNRFAPAAGQVDPDLSVIQRGNSTAGNSVAAFDTSLIQLIANPEQFDGKSVRVIGFVSLEEEGNAIYLHQEDHKRRLTRNGLWLEMSLPKSLAEFNGKYVLVEGTFNARQKGHMGMWSGGIQRIARFQVWERN